MTTETSTPTPLSDREISLLETTLATPAFVKQSMGLDEIQGYLAAIICGPERIPVASWMPAVLGNPKFESAEQETEVKELLQRFYAEILADLAGERPVSLVLDYGENTNEKGEQDYDYAAWCEAFLDGVDASPVAWNETLRSDAEEEQLNELLFPISLLAGEIDPKAFKRIKPQELDEVMTECREDLPMLISDIYKFFEAVRNRPKVTRSHPGSDAVTAKPGKDKLH